MKLLLATRNQGKIAEIGSILRQLDIEVLSFDDLSDEPPEVIEDDNLVKKVVNAFLVAQPLSEFLYEGIH